MVVALKALQCNFHQTCLFSAPYGSGSWPHGLMVLIYGLKPEVWGRVVPDPRAELQVDPARGPQAQWSVGRPLKNVFSKWDIGNTSLCVASPKQANSHSSDASYHGEQGYNRKQNPLSDGCWPMCIPKSDILGVTMAVIHVAGQHLLAV